MEKMNNGINRKPVPHIPGFTLDRCCGRGGSSEVWLGTDPSGRRRAVRLVSKKPDRALLDMEREALSLYRSAGEHEHLVKILDSGETEDHLYCVMEPADNFRRSGGYEPDTLARRICRRKENWSSIVNDLDAIASGVEQLHCRDLVHGDLQPENILFVRGVLKIADPGLVSRADAVPRGGTAGFRPLWKASGTETDIYALGKLIYMMCTHEPPERFPDIPQDCDFADFFPLNEISLGCCEREARSRFHHISEIRRELNSVRNFYRD